MFTCSSSLSQNHYHYFGCSKRASASPPLRSTLSSQCPQYRYTTSCLASVPNNHYALRSLASVLNDHYTTRCPARVQNNVVQLPSLATTALHIVQLASSFLNNHYMLSSYRPHKPLCTTLCSKCPSFLCVTYQCFTGQKEDGKSLSIALCNWLELCSNKKEGRVAVEVRLRSPKLFHHPLLLISLQMTRFCNWRGGRRKKNASIPSFISKCCLT